MLVRFPSLRTPSQPHPFRSLLKQAGLCLAGLALLCSKADAEEIRLAEDVPSQELARSLVDTLKQAGMPDEGVVLYRTCSVQPTCDGQYPEWFDNADWHNGIESSGTQFLSLELLVGTATLNRINRELQQHQDTRQMLVGELKYVDKVDVLAYLAPKTTPEGGVIRWFLIEDQSDTILEREEVQYWSCPVFVEGRGFG